MPLLTSQSCQATQGLSVRRSTDPLLLPLRPGHRKVLPVRTGTSRTTTPLPSCLFVSRRTQFCVDGDSSSPSKPSPVARGPPSAPPPFVLLLGLGIGCSIVMSGLERQEEQDGSPLPIGDDPSQNSGNDRAGSNSTENGALARVGGRDEPAALRVGCPSKLPPAPAPAALPTATPERRQLAPTEFATPSPHSFSVTQQSDNAGGGGMGGNVPPALWVVDPVLAKLVRDFDDRLDEENRAARCVSCSVSSCFRPPPFAACGGGGSSTSTSGNLVAEHGEILMMPPASPSPSARATRDGDGDGDGGVCAGEDRRRGDNDASRQPDRGVALPSRVVGSGATGEEREKGRRFEDSRVGAEGGCGGVGSGGGGGGGGENASGPVGGDKKARKSAPRKKEEEAEVPDGEWRRYG